MKEEITNQTTDPEKLLCPKAGTATSSPNYGTASPKFEDSVIANVLWWMKKHGYAE